MRNLSMMGFGFVALGSLTMGTGCAGALVQPGHRALFFDPVNGGIQHEVLQPGWYRTACPFWEPDNKCPRVDDFDVTYSTAKEDVKTLSSEKLPINLHLALKYRPIVSELYLLDTEIGPNYFDEVIGPEFRSAAIGVLARISYQDLQKENGKIEDEIEKELRHRLQGKHIEVASVLIEKIEYAPQIMEAYRQRVVSQEETLTQKQLLENAALQKKRQLELQSAQRKMELAAQTEQKRMELQADSEQRKLAAQTETEVKKMEIAKQTEEDKARFESALKNKQTEKKLAIEQAQIDKLKAEAGAAATVAAAKGEAESRTVLARASAAENEASAANVTTNQVMMHAYDALGQLGGTGSTFLFGDYSKLPSWLFPKIPGFQMAPWLMTPPGGGAAPGTTKTTHASVRIPVTPIPVTTAKKPNAALDDPYGD